MDYIASSDECLTFHYRISNTGTVALAEALAQFLPHHSNKVTRQLDMFYYKLKPFPCILLDVWAMLITFYFIFLIAMFAPPPPHLPVNTNPLVVKVGGGGGGGGGGGEFPLYNQILDETLHWI